MCPGLVDGPADVAFTRTLLGEVSMNLPHHEVELACDDEDVAAAGRHVRILSVDVDEVLDPICVTHD
jgi:hypothetical protein